MNRIEICKNIIQSIKEYITTPSMIEAHRAPNHFVRSRKLSMYQVILYLLYTSKACLNINISKIKRDLPCLKFPSVSKQAVSKARQFISPDLFKELFYLSVDSFYKNVTSRKTWHDLHIFAIDGSKLELPSSKSNFSFFGEMFSYPNTEHKYTMANASIVYDVLEDYIVHATINPFCAAERASAKEHMQSLEELDIYKNSIIIFDRGYYSEDMFRYCVENNHTCLMRLKEGFNLSKESKGKGDICTNISTGNKNSAEISIRVIEVPLSDGSYEYLATNLFDKSFTPDMFKELYFLRWPVETKYKELKSRLKIEEFSGATSVSMIQEFFLNLMYSNISALIKNEADNEVSKNSKTTNKHRYQANRSFIIGEVKELVPKVICGLLKISCISTLFEDACQHKSQIQPGRSFKRDKHKIKGKRHHNNNKTSI